MGDRHPEHSSETVLTVDLTYSRENATPTYFDALISLIITYTTTIKVCDIFAVKTLCTWDGTSTSIGTYFEEMKNKQEKILKINRNDAIFADSTPEINAIRVSSAPD